MTDNYDIYLRAHTKQLKPQSNKRTSSQPKQEKWPEYALVFDCESRITADQSLTFGFWRLCHLRDEHFVCLEEGIYHADCGLRSDEMRTLRDYARKTTPETSDDGSDVLRLFPRTQFVEKVLGRAIQSQALIVGFHLAFDLSRLALDWEIANNGGWSLILSQWLNPKTSKLEENKFFPRIVIKALNSKTAIIQSMQPWKPSNREKGQNLQTFPPARFLDLRALLWALHNKSYSLARACEKFKVEGKLDHKPAGHVDVKEIEYCRQDVRASVGLLNAARQEYDLHPIDATADKLFSPASVAKAYLEKLTISYPSQKVKNSEYAYGICMQAYYGGRAECRIRNVEVPVCPVDFMSQYATVNELLGAWDVVIANNVRFEEATDEVCELLTRISLDCCFQRKLWPQFKFFALVRPEEDIFPVRAVYNGTTQNIGINYLTSKEPIWFAGPDVIASILLNGGKVPRIEKAIRVTPHGRQQGLGSTRLRGMVGVDAGKQSLFRHVVEQRAANEANPELYYWLKILASSGSYGLFVELNPNEAHAERIQVSSGEESFETTSDVIELPGKWFAPHIGSLTTAGGRLLLAMLESCVADAGGTYLFCDTDSAAIVSAQTRQAISMPDGAEPINALPRAEVERIVARFESLNPYDRDVVPGSILKIQKSNWDARKQQRQLCGYSIAAKRYALYTKSAKDIEIVEPKAHGLGFFYPPKDSPEKWTHEMQLWIFETWDWIMRGVLQLSRKKPSWFDLPVMMKVALSTPHHILQNLEKGPLTRPHNFAMIPQLSRFGQPEGVDPNKFTLLTSFSSERDEWMCAKCINIHDPQSPIYELADEYDGKRALVKNFYMLLDTYRNHPEAKSLGPDGQPCKAETRGLLQRANVVANWPPVYIGKESDKHWEEGEDPSLLEFQAIQYTRKGNAIATKEQLARIKRVPKREFMRRGINQHTLEKICAREPVRGMKLAKCLKALEEYENTNLTGVRN